MDSTSLRLAYAGLLDAAETVAVAGTRTAPPPGEWNADQLLAHLVSVDAGILAAACSVAAGGHATFDNRLSLDPRNLARINTRSGGQARLRQRIRVQGEALCALAEQLSEDELGQPIPTVLQSGATRLVDQPVSLRDLICGLAEDHLPRHAQQLLALLPQDALLASANGGGSGG
ncbi:MAG TPA: DinB family protein [Jatrophihabitans sp.]|jgi:hypothetical protein|nr:DinB family protein [Jatrophihabitans sp.]